MSKPLFRVHFEDGHKLGIHAENSSEARKIAKRKYDGVITKIKLDRQEQPA